MTPTFCNRILPFLVFTSISLATIIKVPQDQPTIQAGIGNAIDGDTVLVDTGRYVENINFNGKNLVLGSWILVLGDTSYISQTIIDGDSNGSVVTFESEEDSTCVLTGFTLTNGQRIGFEDPSGGGIFCYNSDPTISHSKITQNTAVYGGGIAVSSFPWFSGVPSPTLTDITISRNNAHYGGGIYCSNHSRPRLANVVIRGNTANRGGGMYCMRDSRPDLTGVAIIANWSGGLGGGMFCDSSSAYLREVTVDGNLATTNGGGIHTVASRIVMNDAAVTHNVAWEGTGGGAFFQDSRTDLANVTVSSNDAFFSGGGIVFYGSRALLEQVEILENGADCNGGGIYGAGSDIILKNGLVTNNMARSGKGGGIYYLDSGITIERTAIAFNDADHGGGIMVSTTREFSESSDWPRSLLLNVTATGNTALEGGGLFCSNYTSPVLVNTILWNDSPQEIYFSESSFWPSSVTIAYSDIQGGEEGIMTNENGTVNWLEGNKDTNPLFVDVENGDFNLQQASPAIDAGTAFLVWESDTLVNLPTTAYEGNAPDMGAFESPYSVGIAGERPLPAQFALHPNYTNPFNPTTTIEFSMPQAGLVTLTIYDLLGREVETILNKRLDAGHHKVQWNATNVPSGIYLVNMSSGDFSQLRKVMVLR